MTNWVNWSAGWTQRLRFWPPKAASRWSRSTAWKTASSNNSSRATATRVRMRRAMRPTSAPKLRCIFAPDLRRPRRRMKFNTIPAPVPPSCGSPSGWQPKESDMIRVLNFFCVALMGLSILGLYHVSERTRVAEMQLAKVDRQITDTKSGIGVLQTEWARVAGPARIQELAQRGGMSDTSSVELSSFNLLPHRADAPLNNSSVRNANAEAPMVQPTLTPQPISVRTGF